MTPEQIRQRCEEVTDLLETQAMVRYYSIDPTVELTEEAFNTVCSLYCEVMAKGLEMVIERIESLMQVRSKLMLDLSPAMQEMTKIRNEECQAILGWCREQAGKLEERSCDTSSS